MTCNFSGSSAPADVTPKEGFASSSRIILCEYLLLTRGGFTACELTLAVPLDFLTQRCLD
jgi:hypothetical protein